MILQRPWFVLRVCSALVALSAIAGLDACTAPIEHAAVSLESWQEETFRLPPAFAPELPTGAESLMFAPGWRDPKAEGFWSYAFVMWIDERAPDAARIDDLLEKYYSGLMASFAAGKGKDISGTPARVDVVRTAPDRYEARMHLIDAFATFEPIDLRILVDTVAETDERTMLSIQVSPQPHEHAIWRSLKLAVASIQSRGATAGASSELKGDSVSAIDKCIFFVFQAKDNTYWFGSDGQGVYRYDGKAIVQFTTAHGLRGNRIRGIQEDRSGNILVKSDGGLSKFDGRSFRPLSAVNDDPSKGEWRLDPDDLWFIGWQDEGVVYRYDGTSLHRLAFPKTKLGEEHIAAYPRSQFPNMVYNPYDVYTIYKDSNGHVWFGTGTLGACRYDGKTFAWISRDELDAGEDGFGIRSIVEDKSGKFWFSRSLHLFDVDASSPTASGTVSLSYRKEPGVSGAKGDATDGFTHIISSVKDKNGDVWMATLDGNVWRYDGERFTHYPVRDGESAVRLFSIYKDRREDLWLGTHERGVYKFNGKSFEQFKP